ncbi:GTPase HflX [Pseudothermotoga thermarum]|uniref:GTPase HflX n=1 Tax=Pseudothermotoga thermarum TaxID=119394 RepID=UPI00059C3D45|nr:GTPase HflX [Pseudothermotoga thermarum]
MKEIDTALKQSAILVSIKKDLDSLEELKQLLANLEVEVITTFVQSRLEPDPVTYLGKGKLEELKALVQAYQPSFVVIDGEVKPLQAKNIEKILQVPLKDRTQVILDIFAKHATTEESILQVELAKLSYELPRLVGEGKSLSRTGGGIGTRGPGEQKIEERRRYIKRRIAWIRKKLEEIRLNREIQRRKRLESDLPMVSFVGYTNAGKSSLLKVLSKSDIVVSEKMFSSLSPVIRRVKLPNGRVVLMKDTVGFIRNVPHTIIEAFKSTLEEILYSDLLALVVDVSEENFAEKMKTSIMVLKELSAESIPRLIVFNKIDLVSPEVLEKLTTIYPEAVFVSAKTGKGIDEFLQKVTEKLFQNEAEEIFEIDPSALPTVMKYCELLTIVQEEWCNGKIRLKLKGSKDVLERLRKVVLGGIEE